ncbi:hypothetical protein K435DRAFT_233248 [Dendrothele bispora CBS 962.96]|uniref:Uncharacterized protein n=1 Tax=Dendrothele bispora (strain CBS 962.96) TaxID=1314807 RepID=A0A4S8LPX1_DENBC|nr:hypothetical protein K435DRAFT_233248 [Dendrothele bispora CBS 962.96]
MTNPTDIGIFNNTQQSTFSDLNINVVQRDQINVHIVQGDQTNDQSRITYE